MTTPRDGAVLDTFVSRHRDAEYRRLRLATEAARDRWNTEQLATQAAWRRVDALWRAYQQLAEQLRRAEHRPALTR